MTTKNVLLGVVTAAVMGLGPSNALAAPGDQAGIIAAQRGGVVRVAYSASNANRQRGVGKNVTTGQKILLGDVIVTGGKGRLQILLLDQTMFTIGPNSRMTIDKFVYNPRTGDGQLTATVSKGFFRFISGKIASKNPANVKIKTRVATLSIRGTSIFGYIAPRRRAFLSGGNVAIFGLTGPGARGERPGAFTATSPNGRFTVNITKPGVGFQVGANGAFGNPAPIDKAILGRLMQGVSRTMASGSSKDGGGSVVKNSGVAADRAAADAGTTARRLTATRVAKLAASNAAQTLGTTVAGTTKFGQLQAILTGSISASGVITMTPIQGSGSGSNAFTWTVNFATRTLSVQSQFVNVTTAAFPASATGPVTTTNFNYSSSSAAAPVDFVSGFVSAPYTFTVGSKLVNTGAGVARKLVRSFQANDGSGNIIRGVGSFNLK